MPEVTLEYPGVAIHTTGVNELSGARIEHKRTEVNPVSVYRRDVFGAPVVTYSPADAGMIIEYIGRVWADSPTNLDAKITALERLLNTARMWEVSPVDNEDLPLRRGFFRLVNGDRAYIVRAHGSPTFEFVRSEGAQFVARYTIRLTSMFPAYAKFIASPPGTNRIGLTREFSGKLEVKTLAVSTTLTSSISAGEYPSKLFVKIAAGQTASATLLLTSPNIYDYAEVRFRDTGQFGAGERIIDLTTLAVYTRATSDIFERRPWQLVGFLPPVGTARQGAAFTLGTTTTVEVNERSGSFTLMWMPLYIP
jgi:hypothetical protein